MHGLERLVQDKNGAANILPRQLTRDALSSSIR